MSCNVEELDAENAILKARIAELEAALGSIRVYSADTLSGRLDGPDDRKWQRGAVLEINKRARSALSKPEPVKG